jgi:hypothetical protein
MAELVVCPFRQLKVGVPRTIFPENCLSAKIKVPMSVLITILFDIYFIRDRLLSYTIQPLFHMEWLVIVTVIQVWQWHIVMMFNEENLWFMGNSISLSLSLGHYQVDVLLSQMVIEGFWYTIIDMALHNNMESPINSNKTAL